MKLGEVVKYDAGNEDQLAFVLKSNGDKLDLLAFDKNGNGQVHKGVPRRDEGGGVTWKPANQLV